MFFLTPRANTIPSVPCCFRFNVLLSSCLLHPSCRQNVASSSKHDPICAMSVGSVKVLCVFFLSLVQTRSHLCHDGSVYSSHLVAKRGALEQERTSLYHVRFSHSVVSVFLNPWARKIPSVPCSFSVLLPSCLLHASRGQAWRPRARTNQSLPSGFSQSLVSVFLNPWARKIPSVPCSFSVLLPSCLLHASRGQAWRPRARTNQSLPSGFSQSLVCVFLKPRASTIPSVPCRFSVFFPPCLLHASRGQTWRPRASTTQSLQCRFSQSLL